MSDVQIQFRLESKVIEFGVASEQFEFDVTTQGRKENGWFERSPFG